MFFFLMILRTPRSTRTDTPFPYTTLFRSDLNAHEIKCVIGPNGAGKSTFLNLICGTLKPSSGEVIFDGHNIVDTPLHVIARMGIARKFQVPSVFERLSVRAHLEVAQGGSPGARRTEISIPKILDLLDLSETAQPHAGHLAMGQKQLLELGLRMQTPPKPM